MRNFIVTIDGKQYQVGVEEVGASSQPVQVASQPVAQQAPKAEAPAPKAPAVTSGEKLEAPMPGMVKKYCVSEGSQVKKGQTVLILEAMKMDNDIVSPCDGTISFKAQEGSNVDTGAVLAIIG